jgi:uncharacterized protein (DUF58 family)
VPGEQPESRAAFHRTWKANWLIELSVAFIVLGALTREALLASVGIIVALTLAVLGLRLYTNLTDMRGKLQLNSRLPRSRMMLGESVDGELRVRNGSNTVARVDGISAKLDEELRLTFQAASSEFIERGDEVNFPFAVTPLTRGRFQITSFSLTLTDPRHLLTAELFFEQPTWLEILPGIVQPLTPRSLYAGGSNILHKIPLGVDYVGIRDYAPADEDHKVEWKATARLRRLMVKEFHPETETNLRILIDTGGTMHQQSYVGTRLDEAMAVAQLLAQAATTMEKGVGVYFYDETQVRKELTPAKGDEQFTSLQGLTPTRKSAAAEVGVVGPHTQPLGLLRSVLPQNDHVAAYLRLLRHMLGRGYGNAGVYKAIQAATSAHHDNVLIVLTDLETNVDALIEAASTHGARVIVSQIGAPWRLNPSLEQGYAEYQRNLGILKRLRAQGLRVFDVRPEELLEIIVGNISSMLPVMSSRE